MPAADALRIRSGAAPAGAGSPGRLLETSALLVTVWILMAAASLLASRLGATLATVVGLTASGIVLIAGLQRTRASRPCLAMLFLAAAAGFTSYGAWIALIAGTGSLLGLEPRAPSAGRFGALEITAALVLAPVVEELLYRERLLPSLRVRLGTPLALTLSSAAFAIPHIESWQVLGTFLVGMALGAIYLGFRSAAVCIAIHTGLNAAGLAEASSLRWLPSALAATPWVSAVAALACMLLASRLDRSRRKRPRSAPVARLARRA